MKYKRYLLNLVAALSLVAAKASVGTNSWVFFYQPRMPKSLRK
ncbi:MAG: cyclic lactone autoinducer peptide [Tissierellia bacterium]|nr:cyclic lactone autoinducer peptide [Tissierellia bacterium]